MSWEDRYEEKRAEQEVVRAKVDKERQAEQAERARRAEIGRELFMRVEREVISRFLKAADGPQGKAVARSIRLEKSILGLRRTVNAGHTWTISLDPDNSYFGYYGKISEWLKINSDGTWTFDRTRYVGGDRPVGAGSSDLVLQFGRLKHEPKIAALAQEDAEETFNKIEDAVLQYMVLHRIPPR